MSARRVLVTGCSSGIGLATARAFADDGWQVLAGLRDPHRAPVGLDGVERLALDLRDETAIAATSARIDALDVLVLNAGYALVGPYASYTAAQMREQLQVNLLGPALLAQGLLPALRARRGRMLVLSSMSGEIGMPMNAMYCASKFALEGWAESLSHEWRDDRVQVALVEPGGHRTRFADNLRWGEREGLAPREHAMLRGYRAMLRRLLARPGRSPESVARAVLRLANAKRMPLRTRVGGDARAVHALKTLLPDALRQRLLGARFRRMFADVGSDA